MSRRRLGALAVAGLAAVVVLAGCGSDGGSDAAATTTEAVSKPAAAKENAAAGPVCHDLYVAGKTTPCAENTIGPGGGVVFYDAGSVQPWGRFLEAAPWNWNPQFKTGDSTKCWGGCGADPTSVLAPTENRFQDRHPNGPYGLCGDANVTSSVDTKALAGKTGTALGAGRDNYRTLLAAPECRDVALDQNIGAVKLVQAYRGGGLDDWFLPSKDELHLLYRFGNRNGIGGFNASKSYLSSSIDNDGHVWTETFDPTDNVSAAIIYAGSDWETNFLVRPIRAFS